MYVLWRIIPMANILRVVLVAAITDQIVASTSVQPKAIYSLSTHTKNVTLSSPHPDSSAAPSAPTSHPRSLAAGEQHKESKPTTAYTTSPTTLRNNATEILMSSLRNAQEYEIVYSSIADEDKHFVEIPPPPFSWPDLVD